MLPIINFFVIFLHADEILASGGDGKFEKKKTVKKQKTRVLLPINTGTFPMED